MNDAALLIADLVAVIALSLSMIMVGYKYGFKNGFHQGIQTTRAFNRLKTVESLRSFYGRNRL
jgi:hypothetical protein